MPEWLRKIVHIVTLLLGVATVLESFLHVLGDAVKLPGDRTGEMWAIYGIALLGIAWWTRPHEHPPLS